jgi:hypothetical protein
LEIGSLWFFVTSQDFKNGAKNFVFAASLCGVAAD